MGKTWSFILVGNMYQSKHENIDRSSMLQKTTLTWMDLTIWNAAALTMWWRNED